MTKEDEDKKTEKPVVLNPKYPDRDIHGRLLPGHRNTVGFKGINKMNELKRHLWDAIDPEELKRLYHAILDIAYDTSIEPRVRLSAAAYAKEWLIGKNVINIEMQEKKQQTLNIVNMTQSEINALRRVVNNEVGENIVDMPKYEPPPELEEKKPED